MKWFCAKCEDSMYFIHSLTRYHHRTPKNEAYNYGDHTYVESINMKTLEQAKIEVEDHYERQLNKLRPIVEIHERFSKKFKYIMRFLSFVDKIKIRIPSIRIDWR